MNFGVFEVVGEVFWQLRPIALDGLALFEIHVVAFVAVVVVVRQEAFAAFVLGLDVAGCRVGDRLQLLSYFPIVSIFIVFSPFEVLEHIVFLVNLPVLEDRLVLQGQDNPIFQLLETVPDLGLSLSTLYICHYLIDYKRPKYTHR